MQYLAIGLRCLIGAVFLASFCGKVAGRARMESFHASVRDLRVLPAALHLPVSFAVVAGEFVVCGTLAVPDRRVNAVGLALGAGLLVAFAAAVGVALRRGNRTSCGCFGPSTTPLGVRHIVRNAVLAVAAIAGAATLTGSGPVQSSGAVVAVLTGLLIGGLVAVLDDILDLFQPVRIQPANGSAGPR